jgi:hypothetical protein
MDPVTTIFKGFSEAGALKANARAAQQEAQVALDQAAREEGQARRSKSQLEGAQIAAAGASGTTLEGSNSDVIIDNAVQAELDALNARYAGQVKATSKYNESKLLKWQARGALTGAILKGTSEAIRGAMSVSTAGK